MRGDGPPASGPPGGGKAGREPILRPGSTCWRLEEAARAAVLVDGESYFRAFHEAVSRARRSVVVIGWDLDTRVRLLRSGGEDGDTRRPAADRLPSTLEDLLRAAVKKHRRLQVHILVWDFAMVLAHERQWAARLRLGTRSHRRIHFELDGKHPVGASHHQKIAVIDGKVAFAGGIDLTRCRWDTSGHKADDGRREDFAGRSYDPFHDVQAAVDGRAAAALAELAAERWKRCTGDELKIAATPREEDCWPESVEPDFEGVKVGIARTEAAWKDREEVREVEELHKAAIAAARTLIYIENQYLTSPIIAEALARRLQEKDGPAIFIVSSLSTHGWLAEKLMDALRVRFLKRLRKADHHGRLAVWYPALPEGSGAMTVHAKVMIVDDRLARVGSSNLSNRSMGLDSECDLAIEDAGDGRAAPGIRGLLHRLLSEHLDCSPAEVRQAMERASSPAEAIESLRGGERTLRPLEPELDMDIDEWLPDTEIVDPEHPVDSSRLLDLFLPEGGRKVSRPTFGWRVFILALVPLMAALWAWTPLGEMVDAREMAAAAGRFRSSVLGPLLVGGVFVAGSLAVLPVTVLIAATAYVFGPWLGALYAMGGTLLGGAVTYAIGAWAGRGLARRLAGGRLDDLSSRLARRGLLAMTLVRLLPVAPFSVVNIVAGASRIRFRDFMGGTFLGMAPGTLAIALVVNGLEGMILEPSTGKLGWLAILGAAIVGAAFLVRRWVDRREKAA